MHSARSRRAASGSREQPARARHSVDGIILANVSGGVPGSAAGSILPFVGR